MSARLSPDGMYYWDGQAWKSALSPDGRFRWDGAAWAPVGAMVMTPSGFGPPQREPTSWTKPLQYAVAGWYVWSILYMLASPLWLSGMMRGIFDQSLQRQRQLNPEISPPPAVFADAMASTMSFLLWAEVIFYSAVFVVIIIGAWKRWTWMYYVVLVLLGLTALLAPLNLVYVFAGPTLGGTVPGANMPWWFYLAQFLTSLPAIALFVWMLIALIKRGPWAMRRAQWS